MTNPTVSMLVEIPETLYDAFREHVEQLQTGDMHMAVTAALSHYLISTPTCGKTNRVAARIYLDTIFKPQLQR